MRKTVPILLALIVAYVPVARADDDAVTALNDVLKGEISAVETYDQALKKADKAEGGDMLQRFKKDHENAVQFLQGAVKGLGGTPAEGSGAWGIWAKTVEGTAKLFGDEAALSALKQGEEHGVKDYQDLMQNKNLPENLRKDVKERFLPKQQEHIVELDKLIEKL